VDGARDAAAVAVDDAGLLAAASRVHPVPSPDGGLLAWISDRDGRPRAFVAPLPADGPVAEPDRPLDVRVSRGPAAALSPDVTALAWSPDGGWLACQIAPAGGERSRVVLADPRTGDRQEIAPTAAAVTLGAWSPTGRTLGVTIQQEGRGEGAACLVDVRSGASTVLTTGVAAAVCAIGGDARRAVVRTGPRGARRLELIDLRTGRRTELVRGATVAAARFGVTGGTLLLHTDADREHPALLAASVAERGEVSLTRVVAGRDDADLDLVALDPAGARAALVWNDGGLSRLETTDLRGRQPTRLPAPHAIVTGVSFTRDGTALIVSGHGPGSAPRVDRVRLPGPGVPGRTTSLLPGVTGDAVVPRPEPFTGEDGWDLRGWLLRPPGADGPGPALVWLHGGPESEERPGFAPLLQWVAASGITVFTPNVRGSSGRGRTFTQADDGDRRAHSITDVRAAVTHLVRAGIADPDRVAVGGRSYGGYLTLAALTRFPGLFRAGVDVCGMADLETFYAATEPWVAAAATPEYGHPATDAALLRALSPIHRADRITVPLLVVHGAHDTNVPLGEAHRIVAARDGTDVPAELVVFDDEGHEIHDRHTRERFVRDTARWLAAALGVTPW
jgi:dipeptidyl aminopeptidase/acylaminoacyl peptidase